MGVLRHLHLRQRRFCPDGRRARHRGEGARAVRHRRLDKLKRPPYRALATPAVVAFLVVAATGQFAMGVFEVLWSLWLRHLGASVRFVGMTWIAFSVPMLFSWAGGYLADRYSRWVLMFSGYAISAFAWMSYGVTRNLALFMIINVIEGFAVAWSYPSKQSFLVAVVPNRWLGSVQGLEQTSMQVAALIGTLIAPILYQRISGLVISIAGVDLVFGAGLRRSHPAKGVSAPDRRFAGRPAKCARGSQIAILWY